MEVVPVANRQAIKVAGRGFLTVLYLVATFAYTNYLARQKGYAYNGAVDYLGAIPTDREIIVLWMVGLIAVNLIGRPIREWRNTLFSWAPFLVALFLYDFARSVGFRIHGASPMMVVPQIRADEFLGGGRLPTTILQERLYDPDQIHWYDVVVSAIYTSHFLVPYLFAGVLWIKNKLMWRWYAAVFVGVNFLSCLIFALVTTAPPWYASQAELIPEFDRVIAGRGWSKIGLNLMSRVIDKGQDTVNPFAAIPSLHSAQALLIVICVSPFVWKWLRPLLLVYPLTMTFALVYSGEHYLIDVFVGWAIVGFVFGVGWFLRRRFAWSNPFASDLVVPVQATSATTIHTTSGRADGIDPVVPT
jgi:PAP2 superfamily